MRRCLGAVWPVHPSRFNPHPTRSEMRHRRDAEAAGGNQRRFNPHPTRSEMRLRHALGAGRHLLVSTLIPREVRCDLPNGHTGSGSRAVSNPHPTRSEMRHHRARLHAPKADRFNPHPTRSEMRLAVSATVRARRSFQPLIPREVRCDLDGFRPGTRSLQVSTLIPREVRCDRDGSASTPTISPRFKPSSHAK